MPAPLRLVTGGSLMVTTGHRPALAIETKDFAIQFSLGDSGSFVLPSIVSAGNSVSASGVLAGDQTLGFGIVDYRGTVRAQLWFTGTLRFTASSFTVAADGASTLHETTPFSLDGDLQAFPNNPFIGPPGKAVFDFRIKGKGKATTRLSGTHAGARSVTSYFLLLR